MYSLHYIFIVGCQRSGTTLLGQILGAHPQAVLIDENNGVYNLIGAVLTDAANKEHVFRHCLASARTMYVDASRFTEDGLLSDSVTHLVFKAPNTTYDYDWLCKIHHPRLHFVFVVRDVRDVVCSMQRLTHIPMVENQLKRIAPDQSLSTRFSKDLQIIQNDNTADHTRKALIWTIKSGLYAEYTRAPLDAFLVRYEDLVSAPTQWIPRLLDHVGLAGHADTALHHEDVFQGLGPGFTVRTREIDKTSLNRWKRQLTPEAEQDVWTVAGGLMQELGYQRHIQAERTPWQRIPQKVIARPIVATGRGGSGTRLLSLTLREHGLFLGNRLNESEDSVEWIDLIYELAIKKLTDKLPPGAHWQQELIARAEHVVLKGLWKQTQRWGWKLPETMLILPEVARAFSEAQIIHLVRHPLDTCLRRTHMTSRMDNSIGEATLLAAYQWLNWDRDPRDDEDYIRNAASWVYQVDQVVRFSKSLETERYLEIKYEDLCAHPQAVSDTIAAFLKKPTITTALNQIIDHTRRRTWVENDKRAPEVWSICEKTATVLGYRFPD